jgi:hypothetical protein
MHNGQEMTDLRKLGLLDRRGQNEDEASWAAVVHRTFLEAERLDSELAPDLAREG